MKKVNDEKIIDLKRKKIKTRNLKKIFPFYTKHKKLFIPLVFIIVITGIIEIFQPICAAKGWSYLAGGEFEPAIKYMLIMFILGIVNILFRIIYGFLHVKMNLKIKYDLTNKVISSINTTKIKVLDGIGLGSISDKMSNDIAQVSQVFFDVMNIIFEIITNTVFLIYIAFLNVYMFLVIVAYIVLLYIVCTFRARNWIRGQQVAKKAHDNARISFFEQISGIRDVKLLNIAESFTNFSNKKYQYALKVEEKIYFNRNLFRRGEAALALIFEIAFMLFGILFIDKNMLTLAGLLIIYMYYGKIESLVSYLTNAKELTADGEVSATRIFEIIDGYEKETFGNKEIENFTGNIQLENVEFGYNDDMPVLSDLNMKFENGKMTAIVGKSGAGKTTILNLIAKLYDINSGNILFDGISIKELTKQSIRGNVCEVSQSPYIFNATIKENLLFAKPEATEEELINALKQAEIYDDIDQMPNKLDTQIGERGVKLSGGQRQRIAIARLLLKDAKVIVFDEATSALDNNNQKEIVKLLNSLKNDKTIIIVAHRLSTIVGSDKIYMLNKGKVLAEGNHNWLMKNCKEYKQLYKFEEEKAKDIIEENWINF